MFDEHVYLRLNNTKKKLRSYYSAFEVNGSEDIFLKLLLLLWSDEAEFMKMESMPYT